MKQKTFNVMSYTKYEELISNLANRPYEDSIADNEWNNCSCYQYEVGMKNSDDSDWKTYENFLSGTGNYLPSAEFMLYVLYLAQIIEEGDYLIEACW